MYIEDEEFKDKLALELLRKYPVIQAHLTSMAVLDEEIKQLEKMNRSDHPIRCGAPITHGGLPILTLSPELKAKVVVELQVTLADKKAELSSLASILKRVDTLLAEEAVIGTSVLTKDLDISDEQ